MFRNPIIQRELSGILRTKRAFGIQLALAVVFSLLVLLKWPVNPKVDLSGVQAKEVFRLFGYGLLVTLLILVPIFPATSIVREKLKGTLALLFNSPMSSVAIYIGKLAGVMGLVIVILAISVPAAAAAYSMAGISFWREIVPLYGVLLLISLQYAALGLWVSTHVNSTDAAMRITYGVVLLLSVITLGPYLFLQASPIGALKESAVWLRSLSPIPAVMRILGHESVGSQGLVSESDSVVMYVMLASVSILVLAIATVRRLNYKIFDLSRSQGLITDDRSQEEQKTRRRVFLIDPQRRKSGIGPFSNPVMVKEFRCRRFGRSHWLVRLMAVCVLVSLGLTVASARGSVDWGAEVIGGIMVLLQVSLIVLLTPSLAAGMLSSERESGGWQLLQTTPMSAASILSGKFMSVVWTLALVLLATIPGYVVLLYINPQMWQQIMRVLACMSVTSLFALSTSAFISSLVRRTAVATTISFAVLISLIAGTMLVWLGRGAPFGRATVESVLQVNPLAAALSVIEAPGFAEYNLVQANWIILSVASVALLIGLFIQTWRLTLPQ